MGSFQSPKFHLNFSVCLGQEVFEFQKQQKKLQRHAASRCTSASTRLLLRLMMMLITSFAFVHVVFTGRLKQKPSNR